MRLHDLGRAGKGRLPGLWADHVQESGQARKPFCINPACSNFLPEDKRGYPRFAARKEGEEPPAAEETPEKPAAKKAGKTASAKKPAAKTAKASTAKKPAAKKTTTKKAETPEEG